MPNSFVAAPIGIFWRTAKPSLPCTLTASNTLADGLHSSSQSRKPRTSLVPGNTALFLTSTTGHGFDPRPARRGLRPGRVRGSHRGVVVTARVTSRTAVTRVLCDAGRQCTTATIGCRRCPLRMRTCACPMTGCGVRSPGPVRGRFSPGRYPRVRSSSEGVRGAGGEVLRTFLPIIE